MKLKAVVDILQSSLHKRGVPLKALTFGNVETGGGGVLRQTIGLQQGIPIEKAREIVRLVKDAKLKVQAAIQEDQVRVSGKNQDDLQRVMALLRERTRDRASVHESVVDIGGARRSQRLSVDPPAFRAFRSAFGLGWRRFRGRPEHGILRFS